MCLALGATLLIHDLAGGGWLLAAGAAALAAMLVGWFGKVIQESEGGLHDAQVDLSFRWGMGWFIFSEVMFFAAFFGALFYGRMISVRISPAASRCGCCGRATAAAGRPSGRVSQRPSPR